MENTCFSNVIFKIYVDRILKLRYKILVSKGDVYLFFLIECSHIRKVYSLKVKKG